MYRNAYWDRNERCIKLRTWNKDGKRLTVSVPFKPYLYIESPRGEYTSVFETPLDKVEFNNLTERNKFVKEYGSKRFYENFDVTQQFLLDNFWKLQESPDFAINPLRMIFFDIEVDPTADGSFPEAEIAPSEINIITAYDNIDDIYYVFSKNSYNGDNLRNNVKYVNCGNEKRVLEAFIALWKRNDYIDIVTAWNLNRFDMPYVVNRIKKVLGSEVLNDLSPFGNYYETIGKDKMNREYTKHVFSGIEVIDHIDVYAKFKITKQESYKLDFIAQQELGIGKVDYGDDEDIYTFMKNNWNKFVEYNVRDVELLVKLEEKTRYFQILRSIANSSCVNIDKAMGTIPVTNGGMAIVCRNLGVKLQTFIRDIDPNQEKPGGYVSSRPGFAKDIITVDAGSMHPNCVISNNLSMETKVGMVSGNSDIYVGDDDDKFTFIHLKHNQKYELTRKQLRDFIKQMNFTLSPNGCICSQHRKGILAQYMSKVFDSRVEDRKEIKRLQRELEKLENGINSPKDEIDKIKLSIQRLDIQQYSKKIRINSAYGAISSYMNPAGDVDIANAITLMSQAAIRQINEIAKQFVKLKNPSISAKDLENVIIANDTDSSMLTLSNCGVKICENNTVTEEGYKLAQEFDDYINNEFESWMKNTTNTNKCTLYFKREKICDYGVYLKKKGKDEEAKKNYILHILDDEGVKKPKFKYTGVKFARSVLPQELKTAAKKIVESLVLTQNKAETDKLLQQLFEDYKNMSLDVISLIQRCNNMEKYNSKVPDDNNLGKRNWVSGTPGHIRAAMNYNAVLDKLKLTGYEKIKSGDLAKIIFVEKNKFGIDKIAYLDTWPNEFNDVFKIDYRTSFIKTVYDEIKRIYDSVDWPSFNPADNYAFSLFDILELGED